MDWNWNVVQNCVFILTFISTILLHYMKVLIIILIGFYFSGVSFANKMFKRWNIISTVPCPYPILWIDYNFYLKCVCCRAIIDRNARLTRALHFISRKISIKCPTYSVFHINFIHLSSKYTTYRTLYVRKKYSHKRESIFVPKEKTEVVWKRSKFHVESSTFKWIFLLFENLYST